jgi:hypothetical protein
MIKLLVVLLTIGVAQSLHAQDSASKLPPAISGGWEHSGWQGSWSLTRFDLSAKTAVASLGRGGDSCGFSNAAAVIRRWDGKSLEIEISKACLYPVTFRIEREGNRWEGSIDNDVRTVSARGHDS